jgi:biopolymer transport protein ExbB
MLGTQCRWLEWLQHYVRPTGIFSTGLFSTGLFVAMLLGTFLLFGGSLPVVIAQDVAAISADPATDKEEDTSSSDEISYLSWAADSLGLFYGPLFLIISFTLVALFVMNLLTARRENVIPTELIEGFEEQLNTKQYQQAYELAKSDQSFLGHVLSAGLGRISSGYNPALEAMQEIGEEENMRLEHRLSYLALIGTLCPMIGLLGTVSGMIDSFKLIANTATGAPDPQLLARGISTALFTTFVGLSLAIPALAAYNLLRNRVARLVLEVGVVSEGLMNRFQNTDENK